MAAAAAAAGPASYYVRTTFCGSDHVGAVMQRWTIKAEDSLTSCDAQRPCVQRMEISIVNGPLTAAMWKAFAKRARINGAPLGIPHALYCSRCGCDVTYEIDTVSLDRIGRTFHLNVEWQSEQSAEPASVRACVATDLGSELARICSKTPMQQSGRQAGRQAGQPASVCYRVCSSCPATPCPSARQPRGSNMRRLSVACSVRPPVRAIAAPVSCAQRRSMYPSLDDARTKSDCLATNARQTQHADTWSHVTREIRIVIYTVPCANVLEYF